MIQTLNTGNKTLDMEIPLLTMQELDELARFAGYLRWSRTQIRDKAWGGASLTGNKKNVVAEKPVTIKGLSDDQMNAELEKGYSDMLEGLTIPADKAFAGIRQDYGI